MNKYGCVIHSSIPVRAEASHRSEMLSEMLFGELFSVIRKDNEWVYIESYLDRYKGWIEEKHFFEIKSNEFDSLVKLPLYIATEIFGYITNKTTGLSFLVPFGSLLYGNKSFRIAEMEFLYRGNSLIYENNLGAMEICLNAKRFLGCRYLWGGKTPGGYDCSGFVQTVYKLAGSNLPRDSFMQAKAGINVGTAEILQSADLAFFGEEKINHVGILLNKNHIIHCSGEVRIDKFDSNGIYNENQKKYTHFLTCIRRFESFIEK